jgi:hypothetical protein
MHQFPCSSTKHTHILDFASPRLRYAEQVQRSDGITDTANHKPRINFKLQTVALHCNLCCRMLSNSSDIQRIAVVVGQILRNGTYCSSAHESDCTSHRGVQYT